MELLEKIRSLFTNVVWADTRIFDALVSQENAELKAWREFAHLIGAEEIWLARLQNRPPRAAVWPQLAEDELKQLMQQTHRALNDYLSALRDYGLSHKVQYANSAGIRFNNTVSDILLHLALHGQYHRGKVNLMLAHAGQTPAPSDFIAFVRGVPAAIKK